jgi:hypothetical protein
MKRIIPSLLLLLALLTAAPSALAVSTWYVRTDGGTSTQCTGKTDAAYPGSGTAQACAVNNLQWLIPPGSTGDGATAILVGAGDTVNIAAGSYQFGYGSPGASACQTAYTYNCVLISPRKSPDTLTIQGDCSNHPEIWGSGHQYQLFNFTGTSGVTLSCLELTDHSNCIDAYTGSAVPSCVNNGTTYDSAQDGIDATDATNLTLSHLLIHGFSLNGVLMARLNGLTMDDVTIRANSGAGFNGDVSGNDSNSGTILIQNSTISWNGCTEDYPDLTIVACHAANQGGYGDGLGTGLTGGDWVIKNSTFHHNTSDGLDLLYAVGTGSILVDHVYSAYNASQQVKVSAPAIVRNSIINGACDVLGPYGLQSGELCRADGNAVELDFTAASQSQVFEYNTVTGNGDCLISSGDGTAAPGYTPVSSDTVDIKNSILLGQTSHLSRNGGLAVCSLYSNGVPTVTWSNTIVWNTRNTDFATAGMINVDPKLTDETMATFNPTPTSSSPAKGACVGTAPTGRSDLVCH